MRATACSHWDFASVCGLPVPGPLLASLTHMRAACCRWMWCAWIPWPAVTSSQSSCSAARTAACPSCRRSCACRSQSWRKRTSEEASSTLRLPILQVQLRMPVSELVAKDKSGSKQYDVVRLCSLQGTAAAARLAGSETAGFVGSACLVVLGWTVRQLIRLAVCLSRCSCTFVGVEAAGGEVGNMFACTLHVCSYPPVFT